MLTLNDGRSELWQWDTGRTLAVDADCSQVHFSNKVFGRSIDVDVAGGTAIIPNVLLQTDKDLNAWAFVGTAENGYTKISKTFKVNRRNKPADYVFTPVEQTTIAEIAAIAQSVRDDADAGKFNGPAGEAGGWYTPAVTQPDENTLRVAFTPSKEGMPDVADTDITLPAGGSGLTAAQINALDGMFKVCAFIKADISAEYNEFCTAFGIEAATITGISATYSGGNVTAGTSVDELTGIVVTANYSDGSKRTVTGYTLSGTISEGSNTITVTYEGMTTTFTVTGVAEEVTLSSISATYSGGSVPAGTALDDLTGIVVTAQYSDGSTATVTGYTLSGEIVEGSNTITVAYGGMTTTFTVTGVTDSGSESRMYIASDGVLLSERTDIVTASIYSGATEELTDDGLHVVMPDDQNAATQNVRYSLIPGTVTNGKLSARVRINAVAKTAEGNGLRLQLSNGTSGAQIFMNERQSIGYHIGAYEGTTYKSIGTFELGVWYEIAVELNGSEQSVYVDGVKVFTSTTLSANYCKENRIFVQSVPGFGETNVNIEWIDFEGGN